MNTEQELVKMYWKTYFYGFDGFVLEKEIYDLDPNEDHRIYHLKQFKRDDDVMQLVDRTFRMVTAFIVNKQHIAFYEEI